MSQASHMYFSYLHRNKLKRVFKSLSKKIYVTKHISINKGAMMNNSFGKMVASSINVKTLRAKFLHWYQCFSV